MRLCFLAPSCLATWSYGTGLPSVVQWPWQNMYLPPCWDSLRSLAFTISEAPTSSSHSTMEPFMTLLSLQGNLCFTLTHFHFSQWHRSEKVLQLCPQRKTGKDKLTVDDAIFDPDNEIINHKGLSSRLRRAAGTGGFSHKVWSLGWSKVT